jgi:hypothetical protein
MKTATLPPIRVAPDFQLERKNQAEFIRRGIAAIEATQRDGNGVPAEVVTAKLEAKLAAARQVKALRGG